MPSFDDRAHSLFNPLPEDDENAPVSGPLPTVGTTTGTLPSMTKPLPGLPVTTTRSLPIQRDTNMTRVLTAALPRVSENTSQRMPVVIKSDLKKRTAPAPLPSRKHRIKRRVIFNVVGILLLTLVTGLTLLTVTPLGHEMGMNFNPFQLGSNMMTNQKLMPNSLIAQATATAVFHRQTDGYDPNAGGGQTIGNGVGSLNWPVGQCTFWANSRYHQLTGVWVPWNGNAGQWLAGAQKAGWHYSQTPHVPSIIVLMPGVQGASSYGHVAVVENMINATTVNTSNMNWYANGGGWDKVSYVDFTTGSGVWFVWHP